MNLPLGTVRAVLGVAALLTFHGLWAVAGCYAVHEAEIRSPFALSSALGTNSAQSGKGAKTSKEAHSIAPRPAPASDPLDCADKYLRQAQMLAGESTEAGKISESDASTITGSLNQAVRSLVKVMNSWPVGAKGKTLLTSSACPDAKDLRSALKNAQDKLQRALGVGNDEKHPVDVDIASLKQAIDAVSEALATVAHPGPSGPKPPPGCPPTPFLSNIKSAEAFLRQAVATHSLSPEAGEPLRDALQRLPALRKDWQGLPDGSPCDDSNLVFDTPAGNEDISSLLAVASEYLARAAKEAGMRGSAIGIEEELQTVAENIKATRNNLARQAPEAGRTSGIVLGCAALVFLLALSVAFWCHQQIQTVSKEAKRLREDLKKLGSKYELVEKEMSSLTPRYAKLNAKLERQEAALKRLDELPHQVAADEPDATRNQQAAAAVFTSPEPSYDRAAARTAAEIDFSGSDAAPPVQDFAPESLHDPLTDYNNARAMKSSERVEAFRALYPSQFRLECVTSSARTSSDPTRIRFKDDPLGILLALVDGQEALIFPNLTYNYDTGRNSLEGVFVYPPEGVASSRVVKAAVAEQDGEGWRLKIRGQFGG